MKGSPKRSRHYRQAMHRTAQLAGLSPNKSKIDENRKKCFLTKTAGYVTSAVFRYVLFGIVIALAAVVASP